MYPRRFYLYSISAIILAFLASASSEEHYYGASPEMMRSLHSLECAPYGFPNAKPIQIPASAINDDYCDCHQGTDEPGTSACPNGKFYCENKGSNPKTIFSSRVNDGVCDCCDCSDEARGPHKSIVTNTCHLEANRKRKLYQDQLDLLNKALLVKNDPANTIKVTQMLAGDAKRLDELKREHAELQEKKEALESVRDTFRKLLQQVQKEEQKLKQEAVDQLSSQPSEHVDPDWGEQARNHHHNQQHQHHHEPEHDIHDDQQDGSFYEDKDDLLDDDYQERDHYHGDDYNLDDLKNLGDLDNLEEAKEKVPPSILDENLNEIRQEKLAKTETQQQQQSAPMTEDDCTRLIEIPPEPASKLERFAQKLKNAISPEKVRVTVDNVSSDQIKECLALEEETLTKVTRDYDQKQGEVTNQESKVSRNYGPGSILRLLEAQSFSKKISQYEYVQIVFDKVEQLENGRKIAGLGDFDSLDIENGAYYLNYKRGAHCWNGPLRSCKVKLECGVSNEILTVEEPSRCVYTMLFSTPFVCSEDRKNLLERLLESVDMVHDEL